MTKPKSNSMTPSEFRGKILQWTIGADDKFKHIIDKLDNHNKSIGNNRVDIGNIKTEIDTTKNNFKWFVGIILVIFSAAIALLKYLL